LVDGSGNIVGNRQGNHDAENDAADTQSSSNPEGRMANAQGLETFFVLIFPGIVRNSFDELGEFLLRSGKEVTIIEENTRLAADMGPIYRWVLLTRLRDGKARLEAGAKVEEITESGVKVKKGSETIFIEGDTVVLAKALEPNEKLIAALSGKGTKVYAVGDGAKPAKIMEANASGFTLGHEI
jgi:hypothetical protein